MGAPWFGSNVKMALDRTSTSELVACARTFTAKGPRALVVSAPFLAESVAAARGSGLWIGAQGCSTELRGAFTGQVSALDIAAVGCDFVMVGHAERVAAGETLEDLAAQVRNTRHAGMSVLLCVGEPVQRKDPGDVSDLDEQFTRAMSGVVHEGDVLAYEPHWAIGERGREPDVNYVATRLHGFKERIGSDGVVVYGGSVNPRNAGELSRLCDGVFVGRSAWTPEGWRSIEQALAGHGHERI
ncbi:MAG: triose-phosphate isomerase [Candidatus Nanopelagicales bacterium]